MTTKENKKVTDKDQASDNASDIAKSAAAAGVTVKVIGACRVKIGGENHSHGSEFELSESDLSGKGVGYLFAQKILAVKDNEAKTREVIENHRAGAKKDPNEGKTREELENGGEIK